MQGWLGDEGKEWGFWVIFLLWDGVGRTMYFSNKIQNEKNLVLFLHKGCWKRE